MPGQIPCSVNMLTRNSERTLEAALASVSEFAEIIVGDGRSTDRTRAIAARYGCRIIDQDPRYTDNVGRLIDYAGARSQLIAVSSYDWILYLDSDEILPTDSIAKIAELLAGTIPSAVGAYRLQPKHVVNGVIIQYEDKSRGSDPRLFRRAVVKQFVGFVDEYFELPTGYVIDDLDATYLKPLPPLRRLLPKWIRYVRVFAIEATQKGPDWTDQELRRRRSSIRWIGRRWINEWRGHLPNRMPSRYEGARVLFAVAIYATLRVVRISQHLRGQDRSC